MNEYSNAAACPHCGGSTDHGYLDGVAVMYCNAGDDNDGCGWHEGGPIRLHDCGRFHRPSDPCRGGDAS